MDGVAQNALGFQHTTNLDNGKKQIKANSKKIMDVEHERLTTLKLGLQHFFNANMYLHAEAMRIHSEVYQSM
jgi:hypothetical protein